MPDPTLADLLPEDLPHLLRLLPTADLYLQDEVEVALHPTLTRVWCRRGRRGQRLVEAPGTNRKRLRLRPGGLARRLARLGPGRRAAGAAPFCAQLRRALARSSARGRVALVLLDNLSIHTPRGSRLLRALLAEVNATAVRLVLVYTPTYDPDANRIEWLWRRLAPGRDPQPPARAPSTPCWPTPTTGPPTLPAAAVLRQIGSPFAPDVRLPATPATDLAYVA